MKKINIRFVQDDSLDAIEVTVRAARRDADVAALLDKISESAADSISVITDINGTTDRIPTADIILLSVNGKNVSIITENNRFIAKQPLNSIEECLDPARFVRISRYEIVNLAKVVRYDFTLSGTLRIELAGGMETWASRRCIPSIRRLLTGKE